MFVVYGSYYYDCLLNFIMFAPDGVNMFIVALAEKAATLPSVGVVGVPLFNDLLCVGGRGEF